VLQILLNWFQPISPVDHFVHPSMFREESIEKFSTHLECKVLSDIGVMRKGRVFANGCSWAAELNAADFDITLLPGQPVFAIGRRGLTLVVVPYCCPLPGR